MSGDLDININSILVDDDAARIKENLPIERRKARYIGNGLIEEPARLTPQEEDILENCMSPTRKGFRKAIESVLK